MSADPHSPTAAGPEPSTHTTPAGSAMFDGGQASAPSTERPEIVVGAAFAGGILAAMILKRFGSHD
ncbi:MAG: hypothetical protein ACJ76D_00390 [Solirubrobacterales bacterium]